MPFTPGLDPIVHEWKLLRESYRAAKQGSRSDEVFVSNIKYKYRTYWNDAMFSKYNCTVEAEEERIRSLPIKTLLEFENFLLINRNEGIRFAVHARHSRFLQYLMEKSPYAIRYSEPDTRRSLLHFAVLNGDYEKVCQLIEWGANVNAVDISGISPLYLSVNHPRQFHPLTIIVKLLDSGANINAKDNRGFSVLHRACLLEDINVIELLLQRRANVYTLDNKLQLPLQYCKKSRPEVEEIYNDNVRFCGRRQHQKMWAHIMSREVVKEIFHSIEPSCSTCRRKLGDCVKLKKDNYRYWMLCHKRFADK